MKKGKFTSVVAKSANSFGYTIMIAIFKNKLLKTLR